MSYTPIDLSTVAAPDIVENIDYLTILQAMKDQMVELLPDFNAYLDSEPVVKALEVCAMREMLLRQRVNDAARAVMLASATGGDLEQLAALFGVTRKTDEADTDLRYRTQLSLEGLSTAGPSGSYLFHALSVDGVKDASITGPPTLSPGEVLVTLLGTTPSGAVNETTVQAVADALNAEDVRPITDHVTVQSVTPVPYNIVATIYTSSGPDSNVVLQSALASAQTFADSRHKIGASVPLSGLYAALHVAGVERVVLTTPASDLATDYQSTPYCSGIEVTFGGTTE
ncbi:MAG: baseplate J/gp47 family protein [Verrucomicrobium sp.]|nr:baseplate J/gp47 family protein [Verrucomicrobium sp.]